MTIEDTPGREAAPASQLTSPDRDELALQVTFEVQPLNDALISLGVASSSALEAARSARSSDPASDVANAWARHAMLISESVRLAETRANALIEAAERLLRAR